MPDEPLTFHYRFTLPDGVTREFEVVLAPDSLALAPGRPTPAPAWTRLTHEQCPNCPLEAERHPCCPVASSLVEAIEFFRGRISYEQVTVEVRSDSRLYRHETALQDGLRSLLGLYMATAGCPILDRFRPLVLTHLPFASLHETVFRIASMYLLGQFFIERRGLDPDWKLERLTAFYDDIRTVNRAFCKRLSSTGISDASLNALVGLDSLADFATFFFDEGGIEELEPLFKGYWDTSEADGDGPAGASTAGRAPEAAGSDPVRGR